MDEFVRTCHALPPLEAMGLRKLFGLAENGTRISQREAELIHARAVAEGRDISKLRDKLEAATAKRHNEFTRRRELEKQSKKLAKKK